jgi:hypothetical protein
MDIFLLSMFLRIWFVSAVCGPNDLVLKSPVFADTTMAYMSYSYSAYFFAMLTGKVVQLNPNGPDDYFENTGGPECAITQCYLYRSSTLPSSCSTGVFGPTEPIALTNDFVIEITQPNAPGYSNWLCYTCENAY